MNTNQLTDPPPLELRNVTKYYGDFKAVDDVSFTVPAGSICGFLGPNGAGKTTTIRMILEIIKPTSGVITVLGRPLRAGSPPAHRLFAGGKGPLQKNEGLVRHRLLCHLERHDQKSRQTPRLRVAGALRT